MRNIKSGYFLAKHEIPVICLKTTAGTHYLDIRKASPNGDWVEVPGRLSELSIPLMTRGGAPRLRRATAGVYACNRVAPRTNGKADSGKLRASPQRL
jgi:hypothetical protein